MISDTEKAEEAKGKAEFLETLFHLYYLCGPKEERRPTL